MAENPYGLMRLVWFKKMHKIPLLFYLLLLLLMRLDDITVTVFVVFSFRSRLIRVPVLSPLYLFLLPVPVFLCSCYRLLFVRSCLLLFAAESDCWCFLLLWLLSLRFCCCYCFPVICSCYCVPVILFVLLLVVLVL